MNTAGRSPTAATILCIGLMGCNDSSSKETSSSQTPNDSRPLFALRLGVSPNDGQIDIATAEQHLELEERQFTQGSYEFEWVPVRRIEDWILRDDLVRFEENPRDFLARMNLVGAVADGAVFVLLHHEDWYHCELNPTTVAGAKLSEDALGFPAVALELTPEGAKRLDTLTATQRPIVCTKDGEAISVRFHAPWIAAGAFNRPTKDFFRFVADALARKDNAVSSR